MLNITTNDFNFLNSYLRNKKEIYVTSITYEYINIAYNWYISLGNINSENKSLIISLDIESYNFFKNLNVPTIFIDAQIKSNSSIIEWKENEKYIKVFGPLEIAKLFNINIIHSEVDIVFLKDPLEKLKNEIKFHDITCLSDKRFDLFYPNRDKTVESHLDKQQGKVNQYRKTYQSIYGIENFGFSYNILTPKIIKFWEELNYQSEYIKKFPKYCEEGNLQTILIKSIKDFDIKVKILSPFEFVNGMVWNVPYLRQKIKNDCYLIHYNGLDGDTPYESRDKKISKMKENGHWYVD